MRLKLNKLVIILSFLYSSFLFAEEHQVFQVGKTFTKELKDSDLEKLKNSRGSFVKRKVAKEKLKSIKIKSGDSINFYNKDTVVHNVFGLDFNFHQPKDSVVKKTFKKKGTTIVRCAIHPKMKIKVIVD